MLEGFISTAYRTTSENPWTLTGIHWTRRATEVHVAVNPWISIESLLLFGTFSFPLSLQTCQQIQPPTNIYQKRPAFYCQSSLVKSDFCFFSSFKYHQVIIIYPDSISLERLFDLKKSFFFSGDRVVGEFLYSLLSIDHISCCFTVMCNLLCHTYINSICDGHQQKIPIKSFL